MTRDELQKADDDAQFISSLQSMEPDELQTMMRRVSAKSAPRWKRVAVRRAIAKRDPRPLMWILCLDELDLRQMKEWQIKEYVQTLDRISAGR